MKSTSALLLAGRSGSLHELVRGARGSFGSGTSNGQSGNIALVLTLRAIPLTPPPNTNLLSFSVTVIEVSMTQSTGQSVGVPLNSDLYQVDLTKLQSDSAFLGSSAAIPAGTYTNMVVGLSNPVVTYCTQTQGITGCAPASVKTFEHRWTGNSHHRNHTIPSNSNGRPDHRARG